MNQHFDSSANRPDDLEARLSGISLVPASGNYTQIPKQIHTATKPRSWNLWLWIPASTAVLVVSLFMQFPIDRSALDGVTPASIVRTADAPELPELTNASNASTDQGSLELQQYGTVGTLQPIVEGTHYNVMASPVDSVDGGLTEVVAFFWYPCPPCHIFEEQFTDWESGLSTDIAVTRVPAIWSEAMRLPARAYYTAQTLGVLDRMHLDLYRAFARGNTLVSGVAELEQFFVTAGITAEDFRAAYSAESTLEQLQRAEELNAQYRLTATPMLFVAGQYAISPASAGGFQEMLAVTDFLLDGGR